MSGHGRVALVGGRGRGFAAGGAGLLRYDTLRDRPGWTLGRRATRSALKWGVIIPVGFVVVLLVPLWLGLILIAVPAIAVGILALAS